MLFNDRHPFVVPALLLALSTAGTAGSAAGQRAKAPPAFPERDILSPFRSCTEISAPPTDQFVQLRVMMSIAKDAYARRSFDDQGREIVDDEAWLRARRELDRMGLDAGHLAILMRDSRNASDRAVAFYGMFFCNNPMYVFNLISHLPGEPVQKTRADNYPRAIAYMQAHIGTTYGDLTDEQKQGLDLPEPGSPRAKAMGITRAPLDSDLLFQINLKPFFQLLDLDEPLDQAQGLWFLKECFLLRKDLALTWLEPALPRINQLLLSEDARVRIEAIGLLSAIAADDVEVPGPDAPSAELTDFARRASMALFPPIRPISEGLILLFSSPERDALVAAGKQALVEGIGHATNGKTKDGLPYRGFRVERVPDELTALGIPAGAVITSISGVPVRDGAHLVDVVDSLFHVRDKRGQLQRISQKTLLVEFLHDGKARAVEYRVM
jgi:hypothetical protein